MTPEWWIFGYGSLIWNPGFEHAKALIGQIKGYSRKFYQGSDVHRGRPEKLGRVVTLVKDDEGCTWGQAFLAKDEKTASMYLGQREISLGGYNTVFTTFYPRDPKEKPFPVLVYIAVPGNPLFLGPDPVPRIARDIAHSQGVCGHNVEYLSKLIAFMRIELPRVDDRHLYEIEAEVRAILVASNSHNVLRLFADAIDEWIRRPSSPSAEEEEEEEQQQQAQQQEIEEIELTTTKKNDNSKNTDDNGEQFSFVDSVPKRKLRCVHKF